MTNQDKNKSKARNISLVCYPCGASANVLTCLKKFGRAPNIMTRGSSTWHTGKCQICGRKMPVTESRDFFYPDFSLLLKVMNKFRAKQEKKSP